MCDNNISTYGSSPTEGKYVYISSSVSKLSMNYYRLNINVSTSSSAVYNGFGVRVYANIGGSRYLVDTFTISGGTCSQSSFSYDFSISGNTNCYASCICSYCEDGIHSEYYDNFSNASSGDTATYESPAPNAPTSCSASGKYEPGQKISVTWSGASGTITSYEVQYIQYDYGTGAWTSWGNTAEQPGTSTSIQHNIISVGLNRDRIRYRVRALNGSNASGWSPESNDIFHYGVKVYNNGFNWGEIRVYQNNTWCRGRVKIFDGNTWTNAK